MSDATLGWIVIGAMGSLPLAVTAVMWRLKPHGVWKAGQNDDRGSSGSGYGGGCSGGGAGCGGGGCGGGGCGGGCGGG